MPKTRKGVTRVGTSGWYYKHWRGPFYHHDLPQHQWLSYYAQRFDTVEINNTFYRLPKHEFIDQWVKTVPPGFLFSVKASRLITHVKRLKDAWEPLDRFLEAYDLFGEKRGPILLQFPPFWKRDDRRLEDFLKYLPPNDAPYVFEFRHRDWFVPEIKTLLERYGATFCQFTTGAFTTPRWITSKYAYIRFHGSTGYYQGNYHGNTLRAWAKNIRAWNDAGIDVYVYFNNDQNAFAVDNALRLKNMLG